jgi:hypothetical protein
MRGRLWHQQPKRRERHDALIVSTKEPLALGRPRRAGAGIVVDARAGPSATRLAGWPE